MAEEYGFKEMISFFVDHAGEHYTAPDRASDRSYLLYDSTEKQGTRYKKEVYRLFQKGS